MGRFDEKIRVQLDRLVASPEFARTERMARFLRFVVERSAAGQIESLRERQIGIEVFDRPQDWDPKLDNVVRSEARRLRAKLEIYAASASPDEIVRITMPKGGYAVEFVDLSPAEAPSEKEAPAQALPAAPSPAASEPPQRRRIAAWVAAGAACLLGAVSLALGLHHLPVAARSDNFEIVPFSSEIGQQFSPSVSPDGHSIAFVWDGNGRSYHIYLKGVGSDKAQQFTNDVAPDTHPSWSPDGQRIAFLRQSQSETLLILKGVGAGSERILRRIQDPLSMWSSANPMSGCQSLSWSPDGKQILLTSSLGPDDGYGLVLISVDTGGQTVVTSPSGEDQDCYARFSPDGREIALVRYISHGVGDVYTLSVDRKTLRQLTFEGKDVRGLDWVPDGRKLVYATKQRGAYELRLIDRSGGRSESLPSDTASASDPAVSRTGGWMAFVESEDNWNIWRARIDGGRLQSPERFLASSGQNHSPSYSPDGTAIAFVSDRSGNPEIWFAAADGSDLRQMTHFGGPWLGTIRWSPDSRSIVFDARPEGHASVFTMPATGGVPKQLERENVEVRRPSWSRDGQAIYFDSTRGGRPQIWKRSLVNGETVPVTPERTLNALESVDGTRLFFMSSDPGGGFDLWRSKTDGTDAASLGGVKPVPDLDWWVGPKQIYFAAGKGAASEFFSYDLSTGKIRSMGQVSQPLSLGTPSMVVSPDGKWLLYAVVDHTKSDIKIRKDASFSR
jgi:Tol biopolymer transport system component